MRIVNFGQLVDLEHGTKLMHQITVELPSGHRIQVDTDEGTVQQLVDALMGNGSAVEPAHQKTLRELLVQDDGLEEDYDNAGEFFGGDDPGELAAVEPDVVMGTLTEVHIMDEETVRGGLGQPNRNRRPPVDSDGYYLSPPARTVPKDEMGYPIVPRKVHVPTIPNDDGEGDGTQI